MAEIVFSHISIELINERVNMSNKCTIEIFGEKYPIKTDLQPEYLNELSTMVDKNMRNIAKKTHCFSGNKIGVLAALQIAEEYLKLKKDYDELLNLMKTD